MARKLGMFGPRAEVLEAMGGVDASDEQELKPSHEFAHGEQALVAGSKDWSPEQTEQYIDWRLQALDTEIASLRSQLDDLTATRKRWLAVTGGRSKMNGNGGSNGSNGA